MMNPIIKKNMEVVILGLGITGISAMRYLHSLGARVYVSDSRSYDSLDAKEKNALDQYCIDFEGGYHSESFLSKAECIFISPGIPSDLGVVKTMEDAGIPVFGELALAAPVLQSKIIAITGTNGKTTVTTLIGEILKRAGKKKVFVGGNIGRPVLECLMEPVPPEIAVLEVSSFQLENAGDFRPDIGVVLNITPDHLDRHGSLSEYIRAKAKLFHNQRSGDKAIICTDDVICMELADHLSDVDPLLFGHDKDCNGFICESEIFLRWKGAIEKYDLSNTVFDNYVGGLNSAAAILATRYAGCEKEAIEKTLQKFSSLPHRMELVEVIDGISYYNDSKATNTGAVISALKQARGNVVLIAGGRDKGDDYSLLRDAVIQKVKKIVLIGEAADKIATSLEGIVTIEYADSMVDAVNKASKAAAPGDTVLLSPACASFDMFDSYGHRGKVFTQCVQGLKLDTVADKNR